MNKFFIGTESYYGKDSLILNKNLVKSVGKRAVVVTGKTSGIKSGVLNDIDMILKELSIEYVIFDKVENNPSLENVKEGGIFASDNDVDFVIGVGGGSPLDASKAIAVLARNKIEPVELFKNQFNEKPLPIIAIPTTAGTGSEVTPYSILTRNDVKTKMSFGTKDTFPRYAFLDAKYTKSLPKEITIDTVLDALSHSIEGYLSKRSTPVSDALAVEAFRIFGEVINNLIEYSINYEIRDKFLYISILGGMVISHTGTTIMHGMGYSLTYFKDIPHGRANALLMEEYFRYNYSESKDKIDNILKLMNLKSIDTLGIIIRKLIDDDIKFTKDEIMDYIPLVMMQRSTKFNRKDVVEDDIYNIYYKSLIRE